MVPSARAVTNAASGDATRPCRARCITAVPSNANAIIATNTLTTGDRTTTAATTPTIPESSAPDAAAGPSASPATIPTTTPARTTSGPAGTRSLTR